MEGRMVGSAWKVYGGWDRRNWAQKPSLCKMAVTITALESLFLRLETCPGSLCGAETKTLQMRPSQPKSEVVTNRQIFKKPLRNQKIFQLLCTKMALAAKPWVQMTWETTQIKPLVSSFHLPPWSSKSEVVTNRRIFKKPPWNQENQQLLCTKMALATKPWVHMTWETTQINPLVSSFHLPPWSWKSEKVTNRRNFKNVQVTPYRLRNPHFAKWPSLKQL